MLSAKFVRMISDHWEGIADRVVKRIREPGQPPEFKKYPDSDIRERTRVILQSLGTHLVSDPADLARRYEELGKVRFEEGVSLHVLVYALQTIRRSIIQYVRDQGLASRVIDIYAEEELEYDADRLFDTMIYHVVRGYERAARNEPEKFGSAAQHVYPWQETWSPWPL